MNGEQKKQVEEQFKKLDLSNNGFLEASEVKAALKELYSSIDLKMSDADIDHLIKSVDKSGDGKIQIDEFLALIWKSKILSILFNLLFLALAFDAIFFHYLETS